MIARPRHTAFGEYVFVYGTLQRGHKAHALLRTARFVGRAQTRACYSLLSMGLYPGLVLAGHTRVWGELFYCPRSLLPTLDAYEECPDVYRRARVQLLGATPLAFAYMLNDRARYRVLRTGAWTRAPWAA